MPNYYGILKKGASQVIKLLGMPAILRSAAGDRSCTVVISEFSPQERLARQLSNPTDRKALVSVQGLATKPDWQNEMLVTLIPGTRTENEKLRMFAPPIMYSPGGIDLAYELQVRNVTGA